MTSRIRPSSEATPHPSTIATVVRLFRPEHSGSTSSDRYCENAFMITVVELMRVTQQIYSSNYHPIEILIGAFVIYFIICFVVSRASVVLEQRFALRRV